MTTENHYDTIIIGAGLAGLTAAAQLTATGHRTLLLERNHQLGGRARTDDLDGWQFNHGGHALYRNALGHQTLRQLGVEPDGVAPPLAGAQLGVDGGTTHLPIGVLSLLRTRALSGSSKIGFARLLANLSKLDAGAHADITVDEWLAPMPPDAQQVTKALVRLSTYAADTDIMSADAAISQLTASQDGVLYLHGGWAKLCDQIAAVATNTTVLLGQRVTSTRSTADGHVVTTTSTMDNDQQFSARTVIMAAGGPSLTASLLGLSANHFGAVGPAPHAAVLDLALDAMPANHRFVLGLTEPTFFSVHSPPARMAPTGKVAAVAMRYLARDDDGSADEHRASLENVARLAGVDTPVRSRFLRRMTVTNGLPLAEAGGMAGRPAVAISGRPGAFVAGDWVGPRGLLADAAIASGYDAAVAAQNSMRSTLSGTLA